MAICNRCDREIRWIDNNGKWKPVDANGQPHYLTCQLTDAELALRQNRAKLAARMKARMDQDFERAIAR